MAGTHQGYKFLSRSARTNLPCDQEKRDALIAATLETKPKGMTHWSCRTMAKAQGVSKSTVNRLWQLHNLKPHLQAVARSQVHREIDRCGGSVFEPTAEGDRVVRG